MPNIYAHFHCGQRALELTGPEARAAAERYPGAYRVGCQGPDPFFYACFFGPWNRHLHRIANRLHTERTDALFAALLKEAGDDPLALSYTLGFLTHYALDCGVHPYVYHVSCRRHHVGFEAGMDMALHALWGKRLEEFPPAELLPLRREERRALDGMWARVIQALYGERVRGGFYAAVGHMRRVAGLIYDPSGRKRRLVRGMEKLLRRPARLSRMVMAPRPGEAVDCLNLDHRPWSPAWAPEEASTLSVPEMMEKAAHEAAGWQTLAAKAAGTGDRGEALAALGGRSMDTGRPCGEECPLINVRCAYRQEGGCGGGS